MFSFSIDLQHILVDLEREIDVSEMSPAEALPLLQKAYSFLPGSVTIEIQGETARITSSKKPPKNASDVPELVRRATNFAGQGNYRRATELYQRILERDPLDTEARRNLGMALLESGELEAARERFVETVRLAPEDSWTFLLLANSYAKTEHEYEKALRFYRMAYALNPEDPFILTSYGGVLVQAGSPARAREMMEKALELEPLYPNAAYGLALLDLREGHPAEADRRLVKLFQQKRYDDPRSAAVYQTSHDLAIEANRVLARGRQAEVKTALDERMESIAQSGGIPIEVAHDPSVSTHAVTKMAWNYNASSHQIFHKDPDSPFTLHYIAHELEHIVLEGENRLADCWRAFASTARNRDLALRSMDREIQRLNSYGLPEIELTQTLIQMVSGLTGQVFNTPLDMLIEWRVYRHLPVLRPAQILSLVATNQEIVRLVNDPQIRKLTPATIYDANCALNYGYSLFTDWLTEDRTQFAPLFQQSFGNDVIKKGEAIFAFWREMMGITGTAADSLNGASTRYQPGDEYGFVDRVAELLDVSDWYEWQFQGEENHLSALQPSAQAPSIEATPEGTTNPELLRSKDMATAMYLLAALEKFETMDDQEVQGIAFEIAMIGQGGIDFSDPDRRYHLRTLPGEELSGLNLLALMYAGFKRVAPDQDLRLDMEEPYALAQQLYQSKHGESL